MKVFPSGFFPLLFFVLLASSCEKFEPTGENFQEIDHESPEPVLLSLEGGSDTVQGRGITQFAFDVYPHEHEDVRYQLFIEEEPVSDLSYYPKNIGFDSKLFKDGYYSLSLKVYIKSTTESMASQLELEAFIQHYSWIIKIDNRPVSDYYINHFSVSQEGGLVKLSWPEYDFPKFKSYVITRKHKWHLSTPVKFSIPDPKTTSYYDHTFVGGSFVYNLEVIRDDEPPSIFSKEVIFHSDFARVVEQEQKENGIQVTWTSCPYPNNFMAYEIYRHLDDEQPLYRTSNLNDTTVLMPSVFGSITYKLVTRGAGAKNPGEGPISEFELSSGLPHALRQIPAYLLSEKAFLSIPERGHFAKVNAANMKSFLTKRHGMGDMEYTVSDNGAYIYFIDDGVICRLSPEDLEIVERVPAESLLGFQVRPIHLEVNNRNQLLFDAVKPYPQGVDSITLVDMNTKQVLKREPGFPLPAGKLTNDGSFYLQDNGVVMSVLEEERQENIDYAACLMPDEERQVVYSTLNSLVLMELGSGTVLREIPLTGQLHNISIDPLTGYVGGVQYRGNMMFFLIYNMETGEFLKEFEVDTEELVLKNNTLITKDFYLPISLK